MFTEKWFQKIIDPLFKKDIIIVWIICTKEGGFRKHYPSFYNEYLKIKFPEDIDELPFKQKLWHFLTDIYIIPKCKICGNPVSFETRKGQWGYNTYCSGNCAMHDESIKQKMLSKSELIFPFL